MLLTKKQKSIIRETWKVVKEKTGNDDIALGRIIYLRLLEVAPTVQQMFPFKDESKEELKTSKKLGHQGAEFVRHLDKAIQGMDHLFSSMGPRLVALGSRHYVYGAEEAHYIVVGEVLLDVLKRALGDDYNTDVKDAYTTLYSIVSEAMLEGGRNL